MKSLIVTVLFATALAFAQQIPHFLYINTPILKPGEVISGTLDEEDGQNLKDGSHLEVVQGRYMAGEVFQFDLTSTFDGYLTIYGPDKTVLASNDDTTSSEEGDYISSVVTEIPESGRYVFIISGYSDFDLGDYTLSATPLVVSEEGPISVPTEQNGILSYEDDIAEFVGDDEEAGSLGEFNYDSYTFELTEATSLQIDVFSATLDTMVEVLDAEGNRIAFNDDYYYEDDLSTSDYDESIDYDVQAGVLVDLEPGSYEIRAAAYATGFYTLSVQIATGEIEGTAPEVFDTPMLSYDGQPALGNPDAPVKLVIFEDFKCPACKNFETQIWPRLERDYIATGEVQAFAVYYQIIPDSTVAGAAAECVLEQNQELFWDYRLHVFNAQENEATDWATADKMVELARTHVPSINADELATCLAENRYADRIEADKVMAEALDVLGTPSVFINGQQLEVSASSYDEYYQQIREAIENAMIE